MAELEEVAFMNDGLPDPAVALETSVKSFCEELRLPVLRRIVDGMFFILPGVDFRFLSKMSLS